MAEGTTRLNRQVVHTGHWERSDWVGRLDGHVPSAREAVRPDGEERDRRRRDVRRLVEAEVVARLLIDRDRGQVSSEALHTGPAIGGADEIARFARLLLDYDGEAGVLAFVDAAIARGVPVAAIYLDLFQPAARHIGDLWAEDRCTFVDVTLAIGTLQTMLRRFEPLFHKTGREPDRSRQALLLPLPGDQHTFGLSMVTEFFRRAGWSVWNTPMASVDAIGQTVAHAWFAFVGLSASTESRLADLAAAIQTIRRDSCNRHVAVMVGGPFFLDHPEYAARVGADALGENAVKALAEAEAFVARAAPP